MAENFSDACSSVLTKATLSFKSNRITSREGKVDKAGDPLSAQDHVTMYQRREHGGGRHTLRRVGEATVDVPDGWVHGEYTYVMVNGKCIAKAKE